MRHPLNRLAVVDPDWLWPRIQKGWLERYELRAETSRLPKDDTKRQALASQVGADGFAVLTAVYAPTTPDLVRHEGAVEVLRQVWIQQYYGLEVSARWRATADAPPPGQLIHSPYDLQARYSSKRGVPWVGYNVHYSETCDLDRPKLITNVLTTAASIQDDTVLPAIHTSLAAKGLLPAEHLVDCGYTDADNLPTSQTEHGVLLIGPVADDPSWQARAGEGFAKANFTLDWQRQKATCPMGKQSYSWLPNIDATKVGSRWSASRVLLVRPVPPAPSVFAKLEPRILFLLSREEQEALQSARDYQQTDAFRTEYALRAGVESLMSQGMRAFELRKSRYIGCAKTQLQHILIAIAINIVRLVAWWREARQTPPRISAFARLATLA